MTTSIPKEERRKITHGDILLLKKSGVDHWMFDEMFDESAAIQAPVQAATSQATQQF